MNPVYLLSSPVSLVLALFFVAGMLLLARFGRGSKLYAFLSKGRGPLTAVAFPLAIIFIAIEGTWALGLQHNIVFLVLVLIIMMSLFAAAWEGIRGERPWSSVLSHTGLFLVLFGGFFGAPDFREATMEVSAEESRHVAMSPKSAPIILPFTVRLEEFRTDYYEDGVSPKQYTSRLLIDGKTMETSVNHPCSHKGWIVYQSGFDGDNPNVSVIKLVRDPWLPFVLLGILLLAAGAVLSFRGVWKSKFVLPTVLVLAVVFTLISIAKISLGTLVPALRSLWFVPHLIIYMVAYSVLALSLVLGVVSLFKDGKTAGLSFKLLTTASSLLILGMLCGAVWAKFAWGDYWTWDAKECWAAVTWLLTLLAIHIPEALGKNRKWLVITVLLSFLAMQITWYGVNYLPSSNNSLHTYNTTR
ncbi:MAG: cytochrome c biogenesis protein CcsA [Bacteroidales bacterium]|nr:cytochrome c biogenesis protein CcsA [Bacteroidales bacterium]